MFNDGIWWSDTTNTGKIYDFNNESGRDVDFTNYKLSGTAKSMIGDSGYYLAGYSDSDITTTVMYTYERTKTENNSGRYDDGRLYYWEGKVALMYPSDYGYAAGTTCVNGTKLTRYNYSGNECLNKNWLQHIGDTLEWLLNPNSNEINSVFYIETAGYVDTTDSLVGLASTVRPVFYLKPEVTITGGLGTIDSPYTVSL